MLNQYFQGLFNTSKLDDAREESYYSDLKQLIGNYGKDNNKKIYVTALPKKTEAGNPDFRVWDGRQHIIGYIEAKKPTVENLEPIEDTEQLQRYRHTFPNLILTNFFEFRLYRHGELIKKATIGRPFIIYKLRIVPPIENQEIFLKLLEQFFSFSTPRIYSAKQLAIELAKRTRFLRDQVIEEELKEEKIKGIQNLEGFYKAFKDHLISSLTLKDFSNLFSQTIAYGLFAARSRAKDGFNRKLAYELIPHTIGILRDVFRFISSTDLPQNMEWIIDDIAEVLSVADVNKIMADFYQKGKGKDPIIHFYETFLAEYDPKEREKRGVYYTPEPVVSYIVRSIHKLLKEKFGKADGFADSSVTVLDPAAGTLTFPAMAIKQAVEEYKNKYGDGGVHGLIRDHILKNFYAFELMMAPYAIGHLKMGFIFEELNYRLANEERFNLYLTNTLDFTKTDPNQFPGIFEQTIAKESQEALKVKEEIPIMVVMGNPPYSGQSENKGEWILNKINEYKKVNGQPLGEKNPKWLQDDYVKFIRFAQWKIEQIGSGILGFITNHAWLDNPTFRGMRASILSTFDEIYILNLHGSTLKKEKTPQGGKDENVFDIQPGVSITLAIKSRKLKEKQVHYAELWGLREEKYIWLDKHDVITTPWKTINPIDPHYFLMAKDEKSLKHYQTFYKITDIFPVNSVGIVTGRDDFVINFERQPLEVRIRSFIGSESDSFIKAAYGLKDKPASNWYVTKAREKLRNDPNWEKSFTKVLYRPFDERWIFYDPCIVGRTREKVMKNMFASNLGFLYTRPQSPTYEFSVLISNKIIDQCVVGNKSAGGGISYLAPLYIYSNDENNQQLIFDGQEKLDLEETQHTLRLSKDKQPNINPSIFATLTNYFGRAPIPEEIFYYIYAILYSSSYRQKYQEFLKIDFPRIPFITDYQLFKKLAELGKQLIDLHLLKSPELKNPIAKFYGKDGNLVEKREYIEKENKVYINNTQYFEGIKPEVWNYFIGGYQVLDKWLKDRKGRTLSSEDIKHYCKIATALSETIEIQKKIDKLYPEVEESLIEGNL